MRVQAMPWTSPPDDPASHPGDGQRVRTLGPVVHDHRPLFSLRRREGTFLSNHARTDPASDDQDLLDPWRGIRVLKPEAVLALLGEGQG